MSTHIYHIGPLSTLARIRDKVRVRSLCSLHIPALMVSVCLLWAGPLFGQEAAKNPALALNGLPLEMIIDRGDGTFQIVLRPEIGTEPPPWLNGVVEWEYAGQAVYAWDGERQPQRVTGPRALAYDGPVDTITRLLDSEMEDRYGRLFIAKRVDRTRLAALIAAYNTKVETRFGPEPVRGQSSNADDPEPTGGEQFPATWFLDDQSGDGNADRFRWDADGRGLVADATIDSRSKDRPDMAERELVLWCAGRRRVGSHGGSLPQNQCWCLDLSARLGVHRGCWHLRER